MPVQAKNSSEVQFNTLMYVFLQIKVEEKLLLLLLQLLKHW